MYSFLTLWKAGINDGYFICFNLLNKDTNTSKVKILTFFGNTEEIQLEDIVEPSRCNEPVLCSLSIADFY